MQPFAVLGSNKGAIRYELQEGFFELSDDGRIVHGTEIVVVRDENLCADGSSEFCLLLNGFGSGGTLNNGNVGLQRLADVDLLHGGVVAPKQNPGAIGEGEQEVAVFEAADALRAAMPGSA